MSRSRARWRWSRRSCLMDEPFAALDALTRGRMQEELLRLWEDTKFTVLFVTHSIPEAIRIGNRILLLTPHPGRAKAEIDCSGQRHARLRRRAPVDAHPAATVRARGSRRRCRDACRAPTSFTTRPRTTRAGYESRLGRSGLGRGSTRTRGCASPCCSCCSRPHGKSTRACSTIRCYSRRSAPPSGRCSRRSRRARYRARAPTRCRCCSRAT